jgi:hypothetical protein
MNPIRLTSKELHHLIDEHMQKDPRHAIQEMDGWAVNYPGNDIPQHTYYLQMIAQGQCNKWQWKRAYGAHRHGQNSENDQDPGGCHGRYE